MSDNERSDYDSGGKGEPRLHANSGRLRSVVWEHFTVIDKKNYIAVCNICNNRLSFKTTVTNLKKHIERKHPFNRCVEDRPRKLPTKRYTEVRPNSEDRSSFQKEGGRSKHFDIRNTKLSDLGGLEGLIINVIGEDGEDIVSKHEANNEVHEANQEDVYLEEVHEYSSANKSERQANTDHAEKKRKSRIMELQLECLEIKKYNMQLEALLLEQQLSVRRSIFTEPLQYADSMNRGTQTDVGGENTRVFFLADSKGGMPRRHLFSMQEGE